MEQLSESVQQDRDQRYRRAYGHLDFEVLDHMIEYDVQENGQVTHRSLREGQEVKFVSPGKIHRTGLYVRGYRIDGDRFGIIVSPGQEGQEREFRILVQNIRPLLDD